MSPMSQVRSYLADTRSPMFLYITYLSMINITCITGGVISANHGDKGLREQKRDLCSSTGIW